MGKETKEEIIEEVTSRLGRKHRLPFSNSDLYVRISIRQPKSINAQTFEFSYPNYVGTSHPSERDLHSAAKKLYRGMYAAFGSGIQIGGVPIVDKDTYA